MKKKEEPTVSDFSIRLLEVITKTGSNINRFSAEIGVGDSTIRRLMEGKTLYPTISLLYAIAKHKPGIDIDYILWGNKNLNYSDKSEESYVSEPALCNDCYRKNVEIDLLKTTIARLEEKNSSLLEQIGRQKERLDNCGGNAKKRAV